jgi:hypothetical protein
MPCTLPTPNIQELNNATELSSAGLIDPEILQSISIPLGHT